MTSPRSYIHPGLGDSPVQTHLPSQLQVLRLPSSPSNWRGSSGKFSVMANLYKRNSSKVWWIRFQWRGEEVRKSARTTSKQEALRFLARTLEECRKLDRDGRTRRTFEDAVHRFAQEHLPTLKPKSAERYRVSLRALAPTLKGLYLDEITKARLTDFITVRQRAKVTGATIRRDLACLSSMLELAKSWDWIGSNPIRDLDLRSARIAPPRTRYLSK